MGLADEFRRFKAKGKNPRWSWSARSADGKTVVITLWTDLVADWKARPIIYDTYGTEIERWENALGNNERTENLKWARDNCDGLFKVVIAKAADVTAKPRQIESAHAHMSLVMRIVSLDEASGEFRAESV